MKLESLEELRVFTQVVESGSIAGAARALGLPANTIGRRLASLEQRLDRSLLNRSTRTQSLTEAGSLFVDRARAILLEVERTEQMLESEGDGLDGTIKLSVLSMMTLDVLAGIRKLTRQHPRLHVELRVADRAVNPIAEGLDVVLIGGTIGDSALVARKLMDMTTILVASQDYLERHGEPSTVEELARHQVVRFASDTAAAPWQLTGPDGRAVEVTVEGTISVNASRAMVDALGAGLGIALTSPRALRRDPNLRQVLPGYHGSTYPLYAVYPSSGRGSPKVKAVVEMLEDCLRL